LISPFSRSSGLIEELGAVLGKVGHDGEQVRLGLVYQAASVGLRPYSVSGAAPLASGGLGIVVGKGGGDEGRDDPSLDHPPSDSRRSIHATGRHAPCGRRDF